ncbi:LINOLEATE 9S-LIPOXYGENASE 1 [Salix koriyanagi]|uniref:LINOLEATE 9S-LIPOXYGENASE 1 n=1 Tax=Salix koriyanagi TaxID=2511006 RepID=A0A9Q0SAB6_9ROSI|nr:LINOLEATE 9S-LIPOXYGENASE 1 [Salix koriyanagi]
MAVQDSSQPHGLRLLIEDYHNNVDGLEIWPAIEKWVTEYCAFYYPTDDLIASTLHAAVNFGQYQCAGYLPNRPTISRRFMPELGTPEYDELAENLDVAFLKPIISQLQTLLGVSLVEILSRHSTDEVYLGQKDTLECTLDSDLLAAFERFGRKLVEIENKIMDMNNDKRWKNKVGPVQFLTLYSFLAPLITSERVDSPARAFLAVSQSNALDQTSNALVFFQAW